MSIVSTDKVIRYIISTGYGHVTTISSVAGLFGSPKLVDYCSSKFAIMGFMEALKLEAKSLVKATSSKLVLKQCFLLR